MLPMMNTELLQIILEYCKYYNFQYPQEINKPLRSNNLNECVNNEWDCQFIQNFSYDKTVDILNAATYVGCRTLVDLCYASLALYFRCIIYQFFF